MKKITKEKKLKQEIKFWKEICERLINKRLIKSIEKLLKQISKRKIKNEKPPVK